MQDKKTVFRQQCKKRLNDAAKKGVYYKDKSFTKNLLNFLSGSNFKNILLFLPLSIEPSVKIVIKNLLAHKKRIYIPFIEDINFKIVKYRLPLKQGAFNILSCNNSLEFIKKIDIAIVPALGVDCGFRRIGFGKGMYDRFFGSLGYRPHVIFVQRSFCFSKESIGEPHDVYCDYLVLPNKIFVKGRLKNAYNSVNGYGRRNLIGSGGIFNSKKNRFGKISNLRGASKIKS